MTKFLDKSAQLARIVVYSSAFESCVRKSFKQEFTYASLVIGPYRKCSGDPHFKKSVEEQIEFALKAVRSENELYLHCSGAPENAGGSVEFIGKYGHTQPEELAFGPWLKSVLKLASPEVPVCSKTIVKDCRHVPYPWPMSQAAEVILHEVMHTHGYGHGTGKPKSCGYSPGDLDWDFKANTVPYIMGYCASIVLVRSGQACGAKVMESCDDGLKLATGLDEWKCRCVWDRRVAKKTTGVPAEKVETEASDSDDAKGVSPATSAVRTWGTSAPADGKSVH